MTKNDNRLVGDDVNDGILSINRSTDFVDLLIDDILLLPYVTDKNVVVLGQRTDCVQEQALSVDDGTRELHVHGHG